MTIQYKQHIVTASPFNSLRIFFRWRGSVWKAVIWELIIWICCYEVIATVYYFLLNESQQRHMRRMCMSMNKRMNYVPLEFMLGFFVNAVVSRWTDSAHNMGYLDDQAIYVAQCIEGNSEHARIVRRTVVRYLCLTQVLVFRDICEGVRKRFPTYDSIVKAGYMLPEEKKKLESYKQMKNFSLDDNDGKYWLPLNWIFVLIMKAKQDGLIRADMWCVKLIDEVKKFQTNMQRLCNYDWVQIPLAYPQVSLIRYKIIFFLLPDILTYKQLFVVVILFHQAHVWVPIITIMQYTFYLGWMKVGASLLNPFGIDDDDFETNFLIDKNFAVIAIIYFLERTCKDTFKKHLQTCMCIVDDAYNTLPEPRRDKFWARPVEAIYSSESTVIVNHPLIGSAAGREVNEAAATPRMTTRSIRAESSS
uniref:Bestrophin homolog n=1 Tax=Syphacia muris TaxID=451379 RepID=A0A0N5AR82_9BILA